MKAISKKIIYIIGTITIFLIIQELRSVFKDSQLALNYMTHQMCSCLFSMNHNEKFCRNYVQNKYLSPKITVNYKDKSIKASFYSVINSKINFTQEEFGCSFPQDENNS